MECNIRDLLGHSLSTLDDKISNLVDAIADPVKNLVCSVQQLLLHGLIVDVTSA